MKPIICLHEENVDLVSLCHHHYHMSMPIRKVAGHVYNMKCTISAQNRYRVRRNNIKMKAEACANKGKSVLILMKISSKNNVIVIIELIFLSCSLQ